MTFCKLLSTLNSGKSRNFRHLSQNKVFNGKTQEASKSSRRKRNDFGASGRRGCKEILLLSACLLFCFVTLSLCVSTYIPLLAVYITKWCSLVNENSLFPQVCGQMKFHNPNCILQRKILLISQLRLSSVRTVFGEQDQ